MAQAPVEILSETLTGLLGTAIRYRTTDTRFPNFVLAYLLAVNY